MADFLHYNMKDCFYDKQTMLHTFLDILKHKIMHIANSKYTDRKILMYLYSEQLLLHPMSD